MYIHIYTYIHMYTPTSSATTALNAARLQLLNIDVINHNHTHGTSNNTIHTTTTTNNNDTINKQ